MDIAKKKAAMNYNKVVNTPLPDQIHKDVRVNKQTKKGSIVIFRE